MALFGLGSADLGVLLEGLSGGLSNLSKRRRQIEEDERRERERKEDERRRAAEKEEQRDFSVEQARRTRMARREDEISDRGFDLEIEERKYRRGQKEKARAFDLKSRGRAIETEAKERAATRKARPDMNELDTRFNMWLQGKYQPTAREKQLFESKARPKAAKKDKTVSRADIFDKYSRMSDKGLSALQEQGVEGFEAFEQYYRTLLPVPDDAAFPMTHPGVPTVSPRPDQPQGQVNQDYQQPLPPMSTGKGGIDYLNQYISEAEMQERLEGLHRSGRSGQVQSRIRSMSLPQQQQDDGEDVIDLTEIVDGPQARKQAISELQKIKGFSSMDPLRQQMLIDLTAKEIMEEMQR